MCNGKWGKVSGLSPEVLAISWERQTWTPASTPLRGRSLYIHGSDKSQRSIGEHIFSLESAAFPLFLPSWESSLFQLVTIHVFGGLPKIRSHLIHLKPCPPLKNSQLLMITFISPLHSLVVEFSHLNVFLSNAFNSTGDDSVLWGWIVLWLEQEFFIALWGWWEEKASLASQSAFFSLWFWRDIHFSWSPILRRTRYSWAGSLS